MAETKKKTGPVKFFTQVRQEGRKVTWTSWQETAVSTIMVFVMVIIMGAFFFLTDLTISSILQFGLNWLSRI